MSEQTREQLGALERALANIERELDSAHKLIARIRGGLAEGGIPPEGPFALSARSLERLRGVHPDLLAVVHYAIRITPVDFGIPETGGVRTEEMQRDLVSRGKSGTMNSRHLTGHAFDIYAFVDGKPSWSAAHVLAVHDAIVSAATALDIRLRWGGDWDGDGVRERERGENDLVHHELPRVVYGTDMHSRSEKAAAFLAAVSAGGA